MQLSDFDFDLPEGLIAVRPATPREAARLLVARADPKGDAAGDAAGDAGGAQIADLHVADLIDQFHAGDRLVLNNTKVIPARLSGLRHRATRDAGAAAGVAKVEITLLEPVADGTWRALGKPLRKLKTGEEIVFSDALSARVVEIADGQLRIAFNLVGEDFDAALNAAGAMPLPPYIAALRAPDEADKTDYQTVFARHSGAVAAPTASLHFTREMLEALAAKGVEFTEVTLHVGAGTFLPVKVEDVATHKMHAEWGEVTPKAAAEIAATQAAGGRVIAVGTTALRLIETAASGGGIAPFCGTTEIFIYPGYQFRVVDGLMTNFHLPKSTLLMLVSALMGAQTVREIYRHAVAKGYRFFSYGDASLLIPKGRK